VPSYTRADKRVEITGVRSALHDVIRSKGRDPEELDPWFFPSIEDYGKVRLFRLEN